MAALCNRGPLYFCPVISIFYLSIYLFFLAYSQQPQVGCLPYFDTWCGPSAHLECRSEMCCSRLAANMGDKKVAKNRHLGTIAQFCRAISSQPRYVSTIRKKLVKHQYLLDVPTIWWTYGLLAAEIISLVWGTPANFNGFHVLAALLHGTLVVCVSQTAAFNPLPSNRHHRSCGDRLEGKGENYQVCSVQYCVQQLCTVRCTHIWTD